MENQIYKLTDEEFLNLVKSSLNIAEVLFKLGYTVKGNSWGYSQVKQRMTDLNIDGSYFKGKAKIIEKAKSEILDPKVLFCENSKHQRSTLRRTIIKNNLLPYKCAICGIDHWNGKTLSLELDHINGINNDNRLENLRFLCPNCHSQTSTYGSKNRKIEDDKSLTYIIPDDISEEIINTYQKTNSLKKTSQELQIPLNAVKQVVKELGLISKANQRYIIQYNADQSKELNRFGSITECCNWIMDNNLVKTKILKTCRNTLMRNVNKIWKNYYFKLLDA